MKPQPQTASAWQHAMNLFQQNKLEESRQALMLLAQRAAGAQVYHLLSVVLQSLGQIEPARFYLQKAAATAPSDEVFTVPWALSLLAEGKAADALKVLDRLLAASPRSGPGQTARVQTLIKLSRLDDAMAQAKAAVAADPQSPDAHHAMAVALEADGRPDLAIESYRLAGKQSVSARLNRERARTRDAVAEFRMLTEALADNEIAWTHYAFTLNYDPEATLEETLRAHVQYARAVRNRVGPPYSAWNVTRDPDRPLRIGIVSPDLREHAIVSFLSPLLEHYDRKEWHVTAFYTANDHDRVSRQLKDLVQSWKHIPTRHAQHLAKCIRDERIDVCIELSGHTGNHLDALHLRPAPVQITYLGYPNTTGLDTIDHRIVDSITDPPGAEAWAVERLLRIDPCFLCYKPIVDSPDLPPAPCASGGPIRFGSFNLPSKISDRTLALWSGALSRVPDARLILKHALLQEPWRREEIKARVAASGIDASRIDVLPPAPSYREHLDAYRHVDIALDTFPYHGTTTTCEALWMGVPVITLAGDRHASRVGCSLLSAVGLPEFIATDDHHYATIAAGLAADTARIQSFRSPGPDGLRARMRASPLCDGPAFAARFQAAVRNAWREWCAKPATPGPASVSR